MKRKRELDRGAVMVEASIYFPLVICTVLSMIYLGLFQMEESALGFVAERIALEVSREEAYPGYAKFNMNNGHAVDFNWGGNMPAQSTVTSYYKAHHENLGDLYREFGGLAGLFGIGGNESEYETKYAHTADNFKMIAIGTILQPEVTIDRGLFSSTVTVKITHNFPMPGVIRYLGITDTQYEISTVATKNIINSGEFVRNVDLATDLVDYLLQKLGLDDKVDSFISKAKDVMQKIL